MLHYISDKGPPSARDSTLGSTLTSLYWKWVAVHSGRLDRHFLGLNANVDSLDKPLPVVAHYKRSHLRNALYHNLMDGKPRPSQMAFCRG